MRSMLEVELIAAHEQDRRASQERPDLGGIPFHDLTFCMSLLRRSVRVVFHGVEAVVVLFVLDERERQGARLFPDGVLGVRLRPLE